MFDTPEIMRIAQEMARHAGARQTQIARNVANADTPGYRAQDLAPFSELIRSENPSTTMKSTRAIHFERSARTTPWQTFDANEQADPNGNTVSIEAELVRGAQAKSSHDLALTIYRNSLDVLRTSLGRGR